MSPRMEYYISGLHTIGCTPQSISMITGLEPEAFEHLLHPRSTESPRKNPLPAGGYAGIREAKKTWVRTSTMTEDTVREIRRLRSEEGVTTAVLAKDYQVTTSCIKKIIRRSTWKHVN